MRIAASRLLAVVVILTLAWATAACGTDRASKEQKMTPDQAYERTHRVIADVLDAIQPGASATIGESDRNVPCGGLGGNEYSKVQAAVDGKLSVPGVDLQAAGRAAQKVLSDAGWRPQDQSDSDGTKLVVGFSGPAGNGMVILRADGEGTVSADTVCLPNPNSDDPHPEVQPSPSEN